MDHGKLGQFGTQAQESVRREEQVRAMPAQGRGQHPIEPDAVQQWMARGRRQHHGRYVGGVDELRVVGPVEEIDEVVLRMGGGDPAQGFMREPADALS